MEPDLVTDLSGKKEEDVVPLEAENIRGVDKRGAMDDDVGSLRGNEGDGVASGTEADFGELNKLVGVITRDALITSHGSDHTWVIWSGATINEDKDEAVEKEADVEGRYEEKEDDVVEDSGGSEGLENEADEEKGDVAAADGVKGGSEDESDEEKMLAREETMVELSDSSLCPWSEKHKPVERETDLAAFLLAKERFTMDILVPEVEDLDYAFFESVLVANPKVLHLNAGNYNLDNQFFLDLAAPRKWVSTEHMEALVDYVGLRHDERLKQRQYLFLKPWLSSFLTKEGMKWGEDVDTLYIPMIWNGNHWAGLCISLTDWRVLVLDPNLKLKDMAAVSGLLDSVAQMLPYLVEKSGDCGPVAIKFMELHALGNPHPRMDGLTDELVDLMRKQFAMDLYKYWVVPLYMGAEMN
ncbi:hypothetical protein DY000_02039022 [Brassica cretica]|uniref:Ubiquitin-like protease family profile domain-containing protein n=1 Tax=Brassica cretica TaxID=69181 RepID=A0ABQ7BD55_BRACR|nr:hypothetical protein DY000_02039022 [Brassica cretica]